MFIYCFVRDFSRFHFTFVAFCRYNVTTPSTNQFHDWKGAAPPMGPTNLAHAQPSLCKSVSGKAGETDKPVKN